MHPDDRAEDLRRQLALDVHPEQGGDELPGDRHVHPDRVEALADLGEDEVEQDLGDQQPGAEEQRRHPGLADGADHEADHDDASDPRSSTRSASRSASR
jgi:hypothetical protein